MERKIEFQEEGYNQLVNSLNLFTDIFTDTIKELRKQGIDGHNFESLKHGNFQQIFENFHKSQQLKNDVTKNMIYGKYLDLYGYNDVGLGKLEAMYKSFLDREYSFYSINNSFYNYCENHSHRNPKLKLFLENAPQIKVFRIFDFVSVRGNNIKIDVPKELFTVYATNQRQLETIDNVKEFINVAKKLELTSKNILAPLVKYLNHNESSFLISGSKGLSEDLNTINFDYNKILMLQ